MRVTFFPQSAIGYVGYPEALLTRGLASGLSQRGHDVRIVEQRQNPALTRTLTSVGSNASRHVYERFPNLFIHSYEPRNGARLMEWVSRELSLIDVAIAVHGVQEEVARWIANMTHPTLVRVYLAFDPSAIDETLVERLEMDRYDGVALPDAPAATGLEWSPVPPSIHEIDIEAGLANELSAGVCADLTTPEEAALSLERAVAGIVARRHPPGGSSASHSSNSV